MIFSPLHCGAVVTLLSGTVHATTLTSASRSPPPFCKKHQGHDDKMKEGLRRRDQRKRASTSEKGQHGGTCCQGVCSPHGHCNIGPNSCGRQSNEGVTLPTPFAKSGYSLISAASTTSPYPDSKAPGGSASWRVFDRTLRSSEHLLPSAYSPSSLPESSNIVAD